MGALMRDDTLPTQRVVWLVLHLLSEVLQMMQHLLPLLLLLQLLLLPSPQMIAECSKCRTAKAKSITFVWLTQQVSGPHVLRQALWPRSSSQSQITLNHAIAMADGDSY